MVKMCRKCIVCGLKLHKGVMTNISMHKFPRDEYRRSLWCQAINNDTCIKSATICSNHFKESDYNSRTPKRFLKSTAVPSIFNKRDCCGSRKNDLKCKKSEDLRKFEDQLIIIYYLDDSQNVQTMKYFLDFSEEEKLKEDFQEQNITCKNESHQLVTNSTECVDDKIFEEELNLLPITDVVDDLMSITEKDSNVTFMNQILDDIYQ